VKQVDGLYFLRSTVFRVFEGSTECDWQLTVKSLDDTYQFLREVVPSESQNPASVETQDLFALAVKVEQREVEAVGVTLEVEAMVVIVWEDEER